MRFVVYGAGAVGGVIGARLAKAGHDVLLIARGEHHDAIAERGLRLVTPDDVEVVGVDVVRTPADVSWRADDVVMLAMKSQDTVAALDALADALDQPAGESVGASSSRRSRSIPVVCAQNGVHNERAALRRFPRVYGICVMAPTAHMAPGEVEGYSTPIPGLLDIGVYPSGVDMLAEEVAEALRSATFESLTRPDIMRWKYRKLLMNLYNALDAVCGDQPWPDGVAAAVLSEGEEVLVAAGIPVATEDEDRERRGDLLRMRPIEGRRRGGGSTWQSLSRQHGSVETDYLNGEIVLLGRLCTVATPVNEMLCSAAGTCARLGLLPGSAEAMSTLAT